MKVRHCGIFYHEKAGCLRGTAVPDRKSEYSAMRIFVHENDGSSPCHVVGVTMLFFDVDIHNKKESNR